MNEKLEAFRDAIISEEVDNLGGSDSVTIQNEIITAYEELERENAELKAELAGTQWYISTLEAQNYEDYE